MPSLADQISAVFAAPILFLIALVFFWLAIWRLLEWRYRAVIDKTKELAELSRIEVNHWKDAAARSASQAAERVETLKKENLSATAKKVLEQLTDDTSAVNFQLSELAKANSAPFPTPGLWKPRSVRVTDFSDYPRQPPPSATQRSEGR
jgi:hypothetical protein